MTRTGFDQDGVVVVNILLSKTFSLHENARKQQLVRRTFTAMLFFLAQGVCKRRRLLFLWKEM